jgi:phosphosulfolactate synthase
VAKEGPPVFDSPGFLELPERWRKPRAAGLTHLLDKGAPPELLGAALEGTGDLVDVLKLGWGLAYVDPHLKARIAACHAADVLVCLGGTLLEVAVAQDKLAQLRGWAADQGVDAVEVSNGLAGLTPRAKAALVADLADQFIVLAETGAKDDRVPVVPERWVAEMAADLAAGARWVLAEGRESGTVGLYHPDGSVREELVAAIVARLPLERVIFEAPHKAQQAWFVRQLGPSVNLGNVPLEEVLALETLRLGLRADTAKLPPRP